MKSFSFWVGRRTNKGTESKNLVIYLWKFTFPLLFSNLIMILLFQLKCLLVVNNFSSLLSLCCCCVCTTRGTKTRSKSVSKWKTDEKFIVFLWGAWMANYGNEYLCLYSTKGKYICWVSGRSLLKCKWEYNINLLFCY